VTFLFRLFRLLLFLGGEERSLLGVMEWGRVGLRREHTEAERSQDEDEYFLHNMPMPICGVVGSGVKSESIRSYATLLPLFRVSIVFGFEWFLFQLEDGNCQRIVTGFSKSGSEKPARTHQTSRGAAD
jgi:hypothetical protein